MKRLLIYTFCLTFLLSINVFAQKKVNALFNQKEVSVLFVGNSLTYFNELPQIVKTIAMCDSVSLVYHALTFPNFGLEEHWTDGRAEREIKSGNYDFVVLQQGPSAGTEGRTMLLEYGTKFAKLAQQSRTKVISYMVWPSKDRFSDFEGVAKSYKMLADTAQGIFCPAGNAWLNVWKTHPEFTLYGEDNFHPDYRGSLLAALMIYGKMMRKRNLNFVDFNSVKDSQLKASEYKILLKAATETLAQGK